MDDVDEGSDDGLEELLHEDALMGMEATLERSASLLESLASILRYQKQFADLRFVNEHRRQVGRALEWTEDLLEVEKSENSTTTQKPRTWGMKASTMFFHPRPPHEIPRR